MGDKGTVWLPEAGSALAGEIDALFYFVYWVSVVIFVGVVAAMVYFTWKYRRRSAAERPEPVHESKLLEMTWIVVPTILVLIVFTWGFRLYLDLGVAPPDAYEIRVTGKKWLWEFEYPNGTTTVGELVVPANRPVKLQMSSEDVIHSFFVPAFRVKQDVLPNRYTSVWFEAARADTFQVFCTEYCGTQHSGMLARVVSMPQESFDDWVESGGGSLEELPPAEAGELLYSRLGCNACHSVDGSRMVGPTFQGLYGKEGHAMADGSTVVADENYLRQSILQPGAQVVEGYPNVMPASYANLTEDEVSALIAYIESLQ
ncbi:MAG: cytochrome c oxidase subunit II [Bacteroidetes bacterium]|jgi:cytochrome c oxidase subunit 2|nr:cytochrome c oxidase subunit II [Bacteroidota bacterium]